MKTIIIGCLLGVSSFATAQTELKGSPEDLRSFLHPQSQIVTLNDTAEKTAYSDKAVIHLVITSEAKNLSESLILNNGVRENVTKDLISKGINSKDIKSSKFTSTPQYGLFGKKPSTYKVINRISVSVFEEKNLRNVAQVADAYSEVELAKTEFEHTQKTTFELQVKEDVLNKINNQKNYYEKSLGVQLIPVAFRDSRVHKMPTAGASAVADVEEVIVTGLRSSSVSKYQAPEPAEPSFDEVIYKAELSVDYKVVNKSTN